MERERTVVPTRGIIHDIGRAITHKQIIIRYFLKGYLTPEIANYVIIQWTHVIDASKVLNVSKHCLKKNMRIMEISRTLGMFPSFVREYFKLLKDHKNEMRNKKIIGGKNK
jgi:hypothetical protein